MRSGPLATHAHLAVSLHRFLRSSTSVDLTSYHLQENRLQLILYNNIHIIKGMILSFKFGIRFRKNFDHEMLHRQAGMDRYVHNRLLETFRDEYRRAGVVDTSHHRINKWYTELRNETGPKWLKSSVSGITRQILHDLGRH